MRAAEVVPLIPNGFLWTTSTTPDTLPSSSMPSPHPQLSGIQPRPMPPVASSSQSTPSNYEPPGHGGDGGRSSQGEAAKGGKGRWLHHVKDWFNTKEPSAESWMQHKKTTFKKHGIALGDAQANEKLNAPIGTLPPNAILPSEGPSPDEVLKRAREQKRKMRQLIAGTSVPSSQSVSSASVSTASTKKDKNIAPWE